MQGGTKAFQKSANIALVLRTIKHIKNISRMDIANNLGLNKSTITLIVSELLKQGIIIEINEGLTTSRGGRKPVFLGLNEQYGSVIGMEIRSNICHAVVLDITGNILLKKEICFQSSSMNFTDTAIYCIRNLQKEMKHLRIPLLGVGVSCSGIIEPNTGRILLSRSLGLKNYNFGSKISQKLNLPVLIDNDSNCCAWRELISLRGAPPRNFLYVLNIFRSKKDYKERNIIGIGLGIVVNGEVYYGENFSAGEFRSVFWIDSMKNVVAVPENFLDTIDTDDEVVKMFIEELLINLSVIISVLNPGRIYIGGDLARYSSIISDLLENELKSRYVGSSNKGDRIVLSDFDEHYIAQGAAYMFLEKLFGMPNLMKKQTYFTLDWESIFNRIRYPNHTKAHQIPSG